MPALRDSSPIAETDILLVESTYGDRPRHRRPGASRVRDDEVPHADQREILRWLHGFRRPPRMTYLVHGEPGPMATLEQVIGAELGWPVHRPALGESVEL